MRYVLGPEITPALREALLRLWTDVTNAGGAVGLVPPVTTEDVTGLLDGHLRGIAEGNTLALTGFDERDRPAALAFLVRNDHRLMRHWVWLYRVMVHPGHQGRGTGRELMRQAEAAARSLDGVRGIRLTARGGMGLERFYESCGYKEVGRVPDAIRVAEDDLRDDVIMWRPLT
ncbi:Acetyltransferase (GNAT) family protein [Streptomyces aidingensis]|uniref:Acetyltransferase (GNAT) family protein n=2 Tax=Streptomyces aidingensis TaxID=910347 RepID=A0A1I1E0A8_9ACTN|nr:Acetyltransferase (GNAT) family protein [Streptomyces aidingensis]